jgi:hypothetical protein
MIATHSPMPAIGSERILDRMVPPFAACMVHKIDVGVCLCVRRIQIGWMADVLLYVVS